MTKPIGDQFGQQFLGIQCTSQGSKPPEVNQQQQAGKVEKTSGLRTQGPFRGHPSASVKTLLPWYCQTHPLVATFMCSSLSKGAAKRTLPFWKNSEIPPEKVEVQPEKDHFPQTVIWSGGQKFAPP